MANNKKFIVKNGLQSDGNVLIGSSVDNGTDALQVTGSSLFNDPVLIDNNSVSISALTVQNSTGPITSFSDGGNSLDVIPGASGTFYIRTSNNSGIEFNNSVDGVVLQYAGSDRLNITSTGNDFTGRNTTTIEGDRIVTVADQASQGGSFDAATLEGISAAQFVRSDEDDTMDGNYVITGNLTVQGTTTTISSETVTIADNILLLNSNETGSPTQSAGLEVERGTEANKQLIWTESGQGYWSIGPERFEANEIRSVNGDDLELHSRSGIVAISTGSGSSNLDGLRVSGSAGQMLYQSDLRAEATFSGIDMPENLRVQKAITVGNNTGGAQINFDGLGNNGTLYSVNGEIGFLKQNFNYGARLDSNEDWRAAGNLIAEGNVLSDNDVRAVNDVIANNQVEAINDIVTTGGDIVSQTGQGIFQTDVTAVTGNVDAAVNVNAGQDVDATRNVIAGVDVTAGQDVDATRDVIAGRDLSVGRDANITEDLTANNATITNDLIADDIITQTLNANSAIIGDLTANTVTVDGRIEAAIYYDSDDNNFYGDFASVSRIQDIDLVGSIRHDGDIDTLITFATDQFNVNTGGSTRFRVENSFNTSFVELRAPRFVDYDNNAYYVDPANSSYLSNIFIDDYVYHNGEVDTYFGFNANDQYRVGTGGTVRFSVNNTENVSFSQFRAPIYYGSSGTTNFLDIDNSNGALSSMHLGGYATFGSTDINQASGIAGDGGVTIAVHDTIGSAGNPFISVLGDGSAGTNATAVLNLGKHSVGFNPFSNGNKLISLYHDGTEDYYVSTDASGNLNLISGSDATAVLFWSSGANNVFSINANGDIVVNGQTATYASSDATPTIGNAVTTNRLHVNGSIQLNSNDDAIVLGRGTSSILRNNELKFGQGGGFYMDNTTTVKVVGNKDIRTTGNIYAGIFYDDDNTAYYVDPAGDSQMNTIDIDDYIRHRGDTNTFFGFDGNDQITFRTNNTERLNIDNDSADFAINVYAPRYYDSNNNAYFGDFASKSILYDLDVITNSGIGQMRVGRSPTQLIRQIVTSSVGLLQYFRNDTDNTDNSFTFEIISSSTGPNEFRFNRPINTLGNDIVIGAGDIYANRLIDNNDNTYLVDPNGTSVMNTIDLEGSIRHNGDTNTYIQFHAADQFRVVTGGTERFEVSNSAARFLNDVYAPRYYDSNNNTFYLDPASTSVLNEVYVGDGTVLLRDVTAEFGSLEITGGGTNNWEGYSIGGRVVFMHDLNNTSGLYNDVDNEWLIQTEFNGPVRLYHNGVERARTENGYFLANNQMRSPIYYDSNNTDYYGDFASTSVMNVVRVNRLQIDSSSYYIDTAAGNYGTIRVEGVSGSSGTWAGYAIRDDWVFMADGPTNAGIYNDTDNEWAIQAVRNDRVDLYFNGGVQGSARNGFFLGNNQLRSPIYYDSDNTAYYLNAASGNTNTALSINGQISRIGFDTGSDGNNNKLLVAQDYSHWIWNTAGDWGIFWAGNNNPYRSHFSTTNPNEIVFIGNGNLRASIDLDNGDAFFQGVVAAGGFAYNGGGDNISLNPAYGSGGADPVLFDATEYFEKRVINSLEPNENSFTPSIGEYVKATTGPFAGSYVLRTSAFRDFYSKYIPVEPGERLYGEISVRRISGSGGILYYGIERYDQNLNPIGSNAGTTYFVVSGSNDTSTSWSTKRGHHTLPSNVHYVRIRILMNYSGGGALREFGGVMLKRANYHSEANFGGTVNVAGDVYGNRYYDRNNTAYYVDPASTSLTNDFRANIFYDRNNTTYRGDFASTSQFNDVRVNNIQTGTLSDLASMGTLGIYRSSSPYISFHDGTTARTAYFQETAGRFYFGEVSYTESEGSFRAPIFYDVNNTGFYGNFASTSRFNTLEMNDWITIGNYNTTYAYDPTNRPTLHMTGSYPHIHLMDTVNNNVTHGAVISMGGLRNAGGFRKWNIGVPGRDPDNISFGYYDNQTNPHYGVGDGWSQSSFTRFIIYTGYSLAQGSMRSPIFYDSDNTGYYGDFASTSRMNAINVNTTNHLSGGIANFYTSSGSLRGYIQATETNDAHFIIATSGGEDISFRDGGVGGQWNMIIRGDGNVLVNNFLYATRIYDRNNSSYYVDPASTSVVNTFDFRGKAYFKARQQDSAGSAGYVTSGKVNELLDNVAAEFWSGNDQPVTIFFRSGVNAPSDFAYISYDPDYDNSGENGALVLGSENDGTGSSDYIRLQARTVVDADQYSADNSTMMEWRRGGTVYGRINTDYMDHISDMRSPIFYDRNNTGYYFDGASTTSANRILVDRIDMRDRGDYITFYGNDNTDHSITSRNSGGSISDDLRFNSYNGVYFNLDSNNNNGTTYLYVGQHGRGSGSISGWYFQAGTDGNTYASSSFRAPIFYDRNNTGYYADPASTSRFNTLRTNRLYYAYDNNSGVYLDYPSGDYGSVQVNGDGVNGYEGYSIRGEYVFMSSSSTNVGIYNDVDNEWMLYGARNANLYLYYNGRWEARTDSGYFRAERQMRAPIYYDLNDTGYYVDPSTNGMSANLNGDIRADDIYARNWFRNDNSGEGLYNQETTQHFYSDSDDGWNVAGGTGANWIRFRDEYAGTIRGWLYADSGNEFGLLNGGGSWRLRLVNGDWTEVLGSSARANIFYDRNNTGYYADPASTSRFNTMRTNRLYFAYDNNTGAYFDYPGGDYGTVQVNGGGRNNWEGYSINGRYVFMSQDDNQCGIYNDLDNEWILYANRNSYTYIYYNGRWEARADSGYFRAERSFRAPIFYDLNNTGYYSNQASTSRYNQIRANTYYSPYSGGDSNLPRSSYPYGWGFQEDGGWSSPYPDLVLQYHTGITMAAEASYGGIRFERDYDDDAVNFIIGGTSNYMYKYNWMYTNTTGFYSGTNGAHFYPNGQTSYGSWNVLGNRNGYYGLAFSQADSDPHLMFNQRGNGAGGIYWQGGGRWAIYYYHNHNCLGVAGSSTSSSYELYVSGDIYATGNITAYSDERKKRNIKTIDNALEKVLQLRGVSYNKLASPNDGLKEDSLTFASEEGEQIRPTEIGVIAQEVIGVLPEVVTYAEDVDEYAVNYGNMAGLFIESIKDQQKVINNQQQEIDELKEMVQKLMEKIDNGAN